jgi:tetratricopeptide (TPR) repeat protein
MMEGCARAIGLRAGLILTALCLASTALGASQLADAVSLYKQKHYSEAKALLEPMATAQAPDPSACYYLAMTLEEVGGPAALDSAREFLVKATKLEPDNEVYLAEYAGVCLLLADRDNSFSMAMEGKSAMERAISENPADLDAREGLMTFYAQAPWPFGNADKAFREAAEIARRNPKLGEAAYRKIAGIFQKAGNTERAQLAVKAAQNLAPAKAQ